jgi:hypothetical protein
MTLIRRSSALALAAALSLITAPHALAQEERDHTKECTVETCKAGARALTYFRRDDPYYICPNRELATYVSVLVGLLAMQVTLGGEMPNIDDQTGEPDFKGDTKEMVDMLRSKVQVTTFDQAMAVCAPWQQRAARHGFEHARRRDFDGRLCRGRPVEAGVLDAVRLLRQAERPLIRSIDQATFFGTRSMVTKVGDVFNYPGTGSDSSYWPGRDRHIHIVVKIDESSGDAYLVPLSSSSWDVTCKIGLVDGCPLVKKPCSVSYRDAKKVPIRGMEQVAEPGGPAPEVLLKRITMGVQISRDCPQWFKDAVFPVAKKEGKIHRSG